jgi:archaellum component FlaD/FlaE
MEGSDNPGNEKQVSIENEPIFPWDDEPTDDNKSFSEQTEDKGGPNQKEGDVAENTDFDHHLEKKQPDESDITDSSAGFSQKLTSMIGRLTRRRDFFQNIDNIKEGNQQSKTENPVRKFLPADLQVSDESDDEDFYDENTGTYGQNQESFQSYSEYVTIPQSNTEIAKINNQIENINQALENLENEQNTFSSDKKEVQENLASELDSTGSKINDLQDKIETIELNVQSLQEEKNEIRDALQAIEQNMQTITSSHTNLQQLLENNREVAQSSMDYSNKVVQGVANDLDELKACGQKNERKMDEVTDTLSLLMADISLVNSQNQEEGNKIEAYRKESIQLIEELKNFVDEELKITGSSGYYTGGNSVIINNIVKNSTNIKLCMEWLEYLMELVGRNNLQEILAYYEELGWISENVRLDLLRYAEGIDFYIEKTDWKMSPDEHVRSIWFMEKLAGLEVDRNKLSVVEKDIKKVKNGTEIYGI